MSINKYVLAYLALLAVLLFTSAIAAKVDASTVCLTFNGCTGTSTTPSYGNVLIGGNNGEYEFVASSTFGASLIGAQTPWKTNIDAAGYSLNDAGTVTAANFIATSSTAASYLTSFISTASSTMTGTLNLDAGLNFGYTPWSIYENGYQTIIMQPQDPGYYTPRAIVSIRAPADNPQEATLNLLRPVNGGGWNGSDYTNFEGLDAGCESYDTGSGLSNGIAAADHVCYLENLAAGNGTTTPIRIGSWNMGDTAYEPNVAAAPAIASFDRGASTTPAMELPIVALGNYATTTSFSLNRYSTSTTVQILSTTTQTAFAVENSARAHNLFVISGAGNVGISTSSPYASLAISDNTANPNTTAFIISSSTSNATTTLFSVLNTGVINQHGITSALVAADNNGNFIASSSIGTNLLLGPVSSLLAFNSSGAAIATTSIGYNYITGGPTGANPTATIGLSAVNGSATTFMRSDAAPALSQAIIPTWTGLHTFNTGGIIDNASSTFTGGTTFTTSTTTNATTTNLGFTNLNDAILSTNHTGQVVATSSIGANYITGTLGTINTSGPLGGGGALTRGGTLTLTCATCNTSNASVSSIATNNGITGGTITTTGTLSLDTTFGAVWTAASTTFVGGVTLGTATTTSATTTNFGFTNLADSLLSTNHTGQVVATSSVGTNFLKGPASSILAFNGSGNAIATTSIGTNYLTGNLFTVTTAAPLGGAATIANGGTLALTCTTCVTGVSGTTNQITSSGGTTPTLSLPNLVLFPLEASSTNFSNFGIAYFGGASTSTINNVGLFTGNASTTNLTASNEWHPTLTASSLLALDNNKQLIASSTIGNNLLAASGVSGSSCTNCNLTYNAQGIITVASNGSAGGGGGDPFYHPTNPSSATTTPILFYGNASSTEFEATSTAWLDSGLILGTNSNGIMLGNSSTVLGYASSTNFDTTWGIGAGGQGATTSNVATYMTAIGYQALRSDTSSGLNNVAVGYQTLAANTSGSQNTGVGVQSLPVITTGSYNTGIGYKAITNVLGGSNNTGFGAFALQQTNGTGNVAAGYDSGYNLTGNANILLGQNVDAPILSGNAQLDIGNVLYGTSMYNNSGNATNATGAPTANGSIGVSTSSPYGEFAISANNGSVYSGNNLFLISSSTLGATTTLFSVSNTGNITGFGNLSLGSGSQWTITSSSTLPQNAGGLTFTSAGQNTPNFVLQTTGNAGVGTTTPATGLDVANGDVSIESSGGLRLYNTNYQAFSKLYFNSSVNEVYATWPYAFDNGGISTGAGYQGITPPSGGILSQGQESIATSTLGWGELTVASSSAPQISLSDAAGGDPEYYMRTAGGQFWMGTSTASATSSYSTLLYANSAGSVAFGTSTITNFVDGSPYFATFAFGGTTDAHVLFENGSSGHAISAVVQPTASDYAHFDINGTNGSNVVNANWLLGLNGGTTFNIYDNTGAGGNTFPTVQIAQGATTSMLAIDSSSHIAFGGANFGGTKVTTCGGSPKMSGNDVSGTITAGSSDGTSCWFKFVQTYSVNPRCFVNMEMALGTTTVTTCQASTTGAVIRWVTSNITSGQNFDYLINASSTGAL